MADSNTEDFIKLLRFYTTEKNGLEQNELDAISNSDKPIPPAIEGDRQVSYAASDAFRKILGKDGAKLDWLLIREEARRLSVWKEDQERNADRERIDTHSFRSAWEEAWNARNLEMLVRLFREDGIYEDVSLGASGTGHSELRRIFAGIFHNRPTMLRITGIVDEPKSRLALSWTRTGLLVAGMEEREFRGHSRVELDRGRIVRCVEYWDQEKSARLEGVRGEEE